MRARSLSAFRDQFKKVLGPKRGQGYSELGLDEPLVGSDGDAQQASTNSYSRQHGVAPPGGGGAPLGSGFAGGARPQYSGVTGSAADVPSQARLARQSS